MIKGRTTLGITIAVIVVAYVAGYWPEHRRAAQAIEQSQALQANLDAANGRVRLAEVLGLLLRLSDAVAVRNFGEAATLSSAYFDRVRLEAPRQPADARLALERILQRRDDVTSSLARTDAVASTLLREQQLELRRALGYPVDPANAPPQ